MKGRLRKADFDLQNGLLSVWVALIPEACKGVCISREDVKWLDYVPWPLLVVTRFVLVRIPCSISDRGLSFAQEQ